MFEYGWTRVRFPHTPPPRLRISMAKLVKRKKSKKRFLIELSQKEIDFIGGIMNDLNDNPQRKVSMTYDVDETKVKPTKKGQKIVRKFVKNVVDPIDYAEDYDYYDYWKDIDV
jgi:hypothetical protein